MSNVVVALLLGIGFGGWVYAKTQRSTGGNTQSSLITGGASGIVAAILMLLVLSFIPGL